jgi:hypothetical protein
MDRWYSLDLVLRYRGVNSVKRYLTKIVYWKSDIILFRRDIILFKPIFD